MWRFFGKMPRQNVSPLPRSGFILQSQQTMDIELPHDVVSACAKRDEPPSQQAMNLEFPHDVVSACAKRDEPPSRRQPLEFLCERIS